MICKECDKESPALYNNLCQQCFYEHNSKATAKRMVSSEKKGLRKYELEFARESRFNKPDFLSLRDEWYAKLKTAGFEDIECHKKGIPESCLIPNSDPMLKRYSCEVYSRYMKNISRGYLFELLGQYLNDPDLLKQINQYIYTGKGRAKLSTKKIRQILLLYLDGLTPRSIEKKIARKNQANKVTSAQITKLINKVKQQIIVAYCMPKQDEEEENDQQHQEV